jgi:LytTr DNA-binding domain
MSQLQTLPSPVFNLKKALRVCGVALGAGVLLGIIGPFGTFESMPTITRFSFWLGGIFVGMIIHIPLFYGGAWLGQQNRWPPWLWVSLSAVIAALPMTFVINGIFATMLSATSLDSLPQLYPFVLAISLPMQWVSYLTTERVVPLGVAAPTSSASIDISAPSAPISADPSVEVLTAQAPKVAALASRLPARLGKAIICLEMEDHYVRVHTEVGDAMIHMRMADAQTELDGIEGMLVHRSFWVARTAVTGWSRDGKTLTLNLKNGKSVPVARDRQPLVRAAGWLE